MTALCSGHTHINIPSRHRARGGTAVEAAIMMPFLLILIFASINLLLISGKSLRFQYDFAQVTRQTFTKTSADRALPWQNYFQTTLSQLAQSAKLSCIPSGHTTGSCASTSYEFITTAQFIVPPLYTWPNSQGVDWTPANTVPRGSIFYAEAQSTESILPSGFSWMNSFKITLRARAVSVVQMAQNE